MDEAVASNFIQKFHNLDGITVAEKRRSFFQLLNSYELHENTALLTEVTSGLQATTHLEKLFLVQFLIKFRQFDALFSLLRDNGNIAVKKLDKEEWFFKKLFQNVGSEFVHQVLPTFSYALRLKILNKMDQQLSEEQGDLIFDALLDRYGLFMATHVIASCSVGKIKAVISSNPVTNISINQLKSLYSKDQNLIYTFFEELERHQGNLEFSKYKSMFKYLAGENPEMYCNLQEKYNLQYCRIGKRTTKKVIEISKERIMNKPEFYATNLHPHRFVRKMGKDFKEVYYKLFPRNVGIDAFLSHFQTCIWILRYYAKHGRFNLFKNTFDKVFYKKLDDDLSAVPLFVVNLIVDPIEKEKFARSCYDIQQKPVFIGCFRTSECFNIVMRKLNQCAPDERSTYINIFLENCLRNSQINYFSNICEIICEKFKNDCKVCRSFMDTLNFNTSLDYEKLEEKHWNYILTIESRTGFYYFKIAFFVEYFTYLLKQKEFPINKILNYLKGQRLTNILKSLYFKKSKSMPNILMKIINIAPLLLAEKETIENIDCVILSTCLNYNKINPRNHIDIFKVPRLIQSLKSTLNNNNFNEYQISEVIECLILYEYKYNKQAVEEFVEFYLLFSADKGFMTQRIVMWFLRYNPEAIPSNFVLAKSHSYAKNLKIWNVVKCYSHLEIDQKTVDFCLTKLNAAEDTDVVIEPLSILMPSNDFVKLAEGYLPTTFKTDLLDSGQNKQFQLRRIILKYLKNVKDPEVSLPLVLEFCNGDFVASTLCAMNRCFYRIPENRSKVFLDNLTSRKAVSSKKHGFYLMCVVLEQNIVLLALQSSHLTQSLVMSFKNFIKNPTDKSFQLYCSKLPIFKKDDNFTAMALVNTAVPKKYKAKFLEATFDVLKRGKSKFTNVLLSKVRKATVAELSVNFFNSIKINFLDYNKMDVIFIYYLLYNKTEDRFSLIFNALSIFKKNEWNLRESKPRSKLNKLINLFRDIYLSCEVTDKSFVQSFLNGFEKIFSPSEAFEEFIIIYLMQFKNYGMKELSKAVVELNKNLLTVYGKLSIKILANCLYQTLPNFSKSETEEFKFYFNLLEAQQNTDDILLLIYLLHKTDPPQVIECILNYENTVTQLQQINNEIVQMHLNLLLRVE